VLSFLFKKIPGRCCSILFRVLQKPTVQIIIIMKDFSRGFHGGYDAAGLGADLALHVTLLIALAR